MLSGSDLRVATAEAIERLTSLAGGPEVVLEAERVFSSSPTATAALVELRAVIDALDEAGLGDHLAVDLGEVRGLDYYTGLVFRVFAPGLGFEVGGGGRYDTLLGRFGRPLPAVGFMLGLDRLAVLLERQGAGRRGAGRGGGGGERPRPRAGAAARARAAPHGGARALRERGGPLSDHHDRALEGQAAARARRRCSAAAACPSRSATAAGSWCRRATSASCS